MLPVNASYGTGRITPRYFICSNDNESTHLAQVRRPAPVREPGSIEDYIARV
jgi:hypothetical protein